VAHVDRKQYRNIFIILIILTVLEVLIVEIPWLEARKGMMILGLTALAVYKAFLVLWFFMHLKFDAKPIRVGVLYSFLFPVLYSLGLIAEGIWRSGKFWDGTP
jgi:caa(3)-type oxidase subunit IV